MVPHLARAMLAIGVTTFAPTVITASESDILNRLTLIAEGRSSDSVAQKCIPFIHVEGPNISPDETWGRIHGVRGLWAMYQNAGIMLELADFAARHVGADQAALELLRLDATQIRLAALRAIAGFAFSQANENVRLGAFRVASLYTGMTAHMTEFLQANADVALPSFVAAM